MLGTKNPINERMPIQRVDPIRWKALKRDLGIKETEHAIPHGTVVVSAGITDMRRAVTFAAKLGRKLATVEEALLSDAVVEWAKTFASERAYLFVSAGEPMESGRYYIDRKNGEIIRADLDGVTEFHERLLVAGGYNPKFNTAVIMTTEYCLDGRPWVPVLELGDHIDSGDDVKAPIAFIEEGVKQ